MKKKRVGQVADELGYVNEEQLESALEEQRRRREELGSAPRLGLLMVEMHMLTGSQLIDVLAKSGVDELRISEDAFQLTTRLAKLLREGGNVVLVSGVHRSPLYTALVAQLGIAFALIGDASVLLVDANLRHPSLHETFQVAGTPGLGDVLLNTAGPVDAIEPTGVERLNLMPAGRQASDPVAILMAKELAVVMEGFRKRYRLTLVLAPPVLDYADAAILGTRADAVIVPVVRGRTSKSSLIEARRVFDGIELPLWGSILCEE